MVENKNVTFVSLSRKVIKKKIELYFRFIPRVMFQNLPVLCSKIFPRMLFQNLPVLFQNLPVLCFRIFLCYVSESSHLHIKFSTFDIYQNISTSDVSNSFKFWWVFIFFPLSIFSIITRFRIFPHKKKFKIFSHLRYVLEIPTS